VRKLRGRLARLEDMTRLPAGRCPHCPPPGPIPIVEVDEAGNVLSGAYPPRCAACGGPYSEGIRFIEFVMAQAPEAGGTPP
jgi:hypothetical protein